MKCPKCKSSIETSIESFNRGDHHTFTCETCRTELRRHDIRLLVLLTAIPPGLVLIAYLLSLPFDEMEFVNLARLVVFAVAIVIGVKISLYLSLEIVDGNYKRQNE